MHYRCDQYFVAKRESEGAEVQQGPIWFGSGGVLTDPDHSDRASVQFAAKSWARLLKDLQEN